MTTMTNFSATAERIGKTTSEKMAVEAMANALGSVENAIADGDTRYDGRCFIDDVEQYASEGLDSLDKRTLNHISDERISELVHEVSWVGRPAQPFLNIFKIFLIPDNSSTI